MLTLASWLTKILFGVIMAYLWRLGGKGAKPFGKNWRRIGAPIVVFITTLDVLATTLLFIASTLPITLLKDDLHYKGQLWWWLPIYCLLCSLPLLILGNPLGLWLALIQWGMIVCSNTIDWPKWNWYEPIYGFLLGVLI